MTSKVTVLMPVYNAEKYVREAVNSILNQTFSDFEFLIIDDGSTDRSWDILNSYSDTRIRLIQNPTNLKLIATLNLGLKLATGEYIARMDADDISMPERLAKQVEFLKIHLEVGVLGTAIKIVDQWKNPIGTLQFPDESNMARWWLHFACPVAHPTVMMRRSVVERAGGYNPELIHAEDYDLWRKLATITHIANLKDVLLHYRRHESVISTLYSNQQYANGVKISQSLMAETLGENVPLSLVQLVWSPTLKTSAQIYQVSQLIYRLWKATDDKLEIFPNERQAIKQDAARRIIDLARRRLWDVYVWQVLTWGFSLDPTLLGRVVKKRFYRWIENSLQSLEITA